MNELSVINELPLTSSQIKEFTKGCKDQILSGEIDPVYALLQLRAAQKALSELASDDDIIKLAVDTFDKYGLNEIEYHGAKITKIETGVKYDYTVCNDPEWNYLKLEEKEIESKLKARESILKTPGRPQIDNDTGEITLPYISAVKTSKTNLKIEIK
jgi:hypothetical protein